MGSFKPNEYGLFDVRGNGVRSGMTIASLHECCAGATGIAMALAYVWRAAAAALPMVGPATAGFVAC